MSGLLLDTNCISELVRARPEPCVLKWMESADETLLYLSVLTLGDIRKGVAALPQSKGRTQLETWLQIDCEHVFPGDFCPSTDPWQIDGVCLRPKPSGRETLYRTSTACWPRRRYITILRIVSCNVSDFASTHVPVVNPWE